MVTDFNIKKTPYCAVGDYVTDDTAAIQAAIIDAEAVGGKVIAPYGRYHTSTPLIVSDRMILEGDGYADDAGAGYAGSVVFNNNLKGTIFYPGAHDAFQITSNSAVQMQQFQIAYNQSAPSGSNWAGIHATPPTGSNCRSVFQDIGITCADNGLLLTNMMEFRINNVNLLYGFNNGIVVNNPLYPSWGDCFIENSTMWGNGVYFTCHIYVGSCGGLRIINNKMNGGNPTASNGILLTPNLAVSQNMEPIIIVGNSLEGQAVGINLVNGHPATASMTEVVICGNQIWSGTNAILCNTSGTPKWLNGFSITGNVLMSLNGSAQPVVLLDNAQMGIITGNQFAFSAGGAGTGLILGALTSNVNVQSNVYGAGMTPVNNAAGAANKVGGGSP